MSVPILQIPIQSEAVKPFIKQGDTIETIYFEIDASDGIDLTGALIKMQLFRGCEKVMDINSTDGITITSDRTFEIDKVDKNDLPSGESIGDLKFELANGTTEIYFNVVYTIQKRYTS